MLIMAKYRKLPVEIEAFKLGFDSIPDWFADAITLKVVTLYCDNRNERDTFEECINTNCDIQTLEGIMHANNGDYIIKDINGELYPCKPDIFEKTYERVEDGECNG